MDQIGPIEDNRELKGFIREQGIFLESTIILLLAHYIQKLFNCLNKCECSLEAFVNSQHGKNILTYLKFMRHYTVFKLVLH